MKKHTPWPWKSTALDSQKSIFVIKSEDGETVAINFGEANAKLIALAPEVLRDLKSLIMIVDSYAQISKRGNEAIRVVERVRQTITKAEGER